jgi:fermentation-respiration switch protein FrsA (DUF1100 family)
MSIKWPYLICLVFLVAISFHFFYARIENFFVFFPQKAFAQTPADLNLDYEEVYFDTAEGKRLHGWFFPLEKERPVILFCHGNAGNISHRLDNIRLLLNHRLQVFIFDYRGYGKSEGAPSEIGIYTDGLTAYDYLVDKRHLAPEQIIPFGRSLGAAVAIEISLKKRVRSVITESAFTSTKDMAKGMGIFRLISTFLPAHYNVLEKILHVHVPKLIVHGERDEIVPFSMGQRIFDAANMPKYFYSLKEAGHNDTYVAGGDEYFRTITTFAMNGKI